MPTVTWEDVLRSVTQTQGVTTLDLPSAFPINVSVDALLAERVRRLNDDFESATTPPHNPVLVEPLLADVAALLDRCIVAHREASELEIKFVTFRLESQLADDLAAIDEELAVRAFDDAAAQATEDGNTAAASAFNSATAQDPLAAGFAEQSETIARSTRALRVTASRRETLTVDRFARLTAYRDALESRHTAPGGAHNYLERYERVTTLLFEDFDEAYLKARAAAVGLRVVFRLGTFEIRFPDLTSAQELGPIFELVRWTRRMMRAIETLAENELEFDLVVPLVQTFRDVNLLVEPPLPPDFPPMPPVPPFPPPFPSPPLVIVVTAPLVDPALFNVAMRNVGAGGSGRVEFTIENLFRGNHLRARAMAVGLSFVVSDATQPRLQGLRLAATLLPPPIRLQDGQTLRRKPLVFGNVLPYGPQFAVSTLSGLPVHNLDPDGEWVLMVHRYVVGPGTALQERSPADIIDFRLHFRVLSEPITGDNGIGGNVAGPV